MSVIGMDAHTEDGIAVKICLYYCDGCGKIVRPKKWRGRLRLAIDPPPAGWVETLDNGQRLAWCRPECEKPAYAMPDEERVALFKTRVKTVERAQKKLLKKILGLYPWEKAPWEKGFGK